MRNDPVFYIRRKCVTTNLAGDGMCLCRPDSDRSIVLKGPAALLWTMADGTRSVASIRRRIAKQFHMPNSLAKAALDASIVRLRTEEVLLVAARESRSAPQKPAVGPADPSIESRG